LATFIVVPILTVLPSPSAVSAETQVFHLQVGEAETTDPGDSRSFTLEPGAQVIQFTRADLTVGNNATGTFLTLGSSTHTVTGDLSGTIIAAEGGNGVTISWSGLPEATSKGYVMQKFTFSDGAGSGFEGILVADVDAPMAVPPPYGTMNGYVFSTSGTGMFSDGKLIGTVEATSDSPITNMTLRWYSSAEISGPQAFSSNGVPTGTGNGPAFLGSGSLAEDKIIQFTKDGISVLGSDSILYMPGAVFSGSLTGGLSGTLGFSMNGITCGVYPTFSGWTVGTFTHIGASGTMKGIALSDAGDNVTEPSPGYMLATMEGTTGAYAGKDYFGETTFQPGADPTYTMSGNLYTLTPSGIVVPEPPEPPASPPRTLNLSVAEPFFSASGDVRTFTLEPGSQVAQFSRADLTVGNNATGMFVTLGKSGQAVTGDLSGTSIVTEGNGVNISWDGLSSWKGYTMAKFTFYDGWGNNFEGILAADLDAPMALPPPYGTINGYVFSTSGTGIFSDGRLIGTVEATSDSPIASLTLRWYSSAEISGPQAMNGEGVVGTLVGNGAPVGAGYLTESTILQFTRDGVSILGSDGIFYTPMNTLNGTLSGGLDGTMSASLNGIACGVYPTSNFGWNVGTFTHVGASGTMKGVVLDDGWVDDTGTQHSLGYMIATMEGTTGIYAGKDYFMDFEGGPPAETTYTMSGNLYTLTPPTTVPPVGPMETLHLSLGELTYVQDFNSRPANLQTGDEIIQFTRPDLIVGTNPVSYFNTMSVATQPVSGDLSGTMTVSLDSLIATWDGMPSATWRGYVFGTFIFDDGLGNTFTGVHVGDEDVDSTVPIGTTSGYVLSTSGTGQFSGQALIGTVEGTGSTTTMTLRRYFSGEISSPRVFNSTATVGEPPPQRSMGPSSGPYPTDDFVQFSPPNVSIPKGDFAIYLSGISSTGSVTGGFTGTIVDGWNDIGTSIGGVGIGRFTYADSNGTIAGVRLRDRTAFGPGHGYMFALMGIGNLTGDYAGKDYYGTFNETEMGETNSFEGNLYTLTPPTTVPPVGPNRPTNVSPSNEATGIGLTPTLTSSAFSDPDAGDTHAASQWQVMTSSGSYSSPVYDSGTDPTNRTSIIVPSLNYSTTYYWHARYQDNNGVWSDWSAETSFVTTVKADSVVTFPDPNLEAAIRQTIGKPSGDILRSDLAYLPGMLDLSGRGISNLAGLEYCTNLGWLGLRSNQISDLSPLAGLTNLSYLWLDSNQISALSPLAGLANLRQLGLSSNQISDLSPLAGLTNLSYLWLDSNQISALSPLAGLANLRQLGLSSNQISDLSPLAGLANLFMLNLAYNQIGDLSPLAGGLANLPGEPPLWLDFYSNQISDIEPLLSTGLGENSTLFLSSNPLSEISIGTYIPYLRDTMGVAGVFYGPDQQPPAQPSDLLPPNGATDVSLTPTLELWSIHDPGTGAAGQWQITTNSGDYSTPVLNTTLGVPHYDPAFWQLRVPPGTLDYGAIYYWHMRYRERYGDWSQWSMERSFTTKVGSPPTVTTVGFSNVYATSATDNGYLVSMGSASSVEVFFEVASDEYYVNSGNTYQMEVWVATMTSPGPFSWRGAGALPNTTYHTRAKAVGNDGAIAYGVDLVATTADVGSDGDGVPAGVEDSAPNGGDGNYDGVLDSLQANVSSFPDVTSSGYVTLESPPGTNLVGAASVTEGSLPSQGRPSLEFPYGFFAFEVGGLTAGESVTLTITLPSAVPVGSQYWRFGPTPSDYNPHWYQITMGSDDGDNVITITLVDGGLGDDDLTANGTILDFGQGGPGRTNSDQPTDRYEVTSASYAQHTGVPFPVTVTALDSTGNVVTDDSFTVVTITSSSPTMVFDGNGNGTFGELGDDTMTLASGTFEIQAEDSTPTSGVSITATDTNGKTGTSHAYTIAGLAVSISFTPEGGTATAGAPFTVTVVARDINGNIASGYTGTVSFASSDNSSLPANYTFTVADCGAHTFTNGVTLRVSGSQSVTVSDIVNAALTDTESWSVNAGAADHVVISPDTATITAGNSQTYSVEAFDQFNNSIGDVTSSTAFSMIETGHGGSWANNVYTSANAGSWTVTSTYGGLTDTTALTVMATSVAYIVISPDNAAITAGNSQAYTAQSFDRFNNVIADVTTSTAFGITPAAGGAWATNVYTSANAGSWTVTGTYIGFVDNTSLTVNAGPLHHIIVSPDGATIIAGSSQTYTAQTADQFDNPIADVTSSTAFSIDVGAGGFWAANVYTSANAGTWIVTGTYIGFVDNTSLTVNAGPLHHIIVSPGGATIIAGSSQTYTAQSFDQFNNLIADISSSTVFSIPVGAGGSWTNNVYTSANAGTWIVTGTYMGFMDTASLVVEAPAPVGPSCPVNELPAHGATGVEVTPTLHASAFDDPDGGSHATSQWQVRTSSGSYSAAVFDSLTDSAHLETIDVPVDTLGHSTAYYWRVRYQDDDGLWSEWSAETSFATVSLPLDLDFVASSRDVVAGQSVRLTAVCVGGEAPLSYEWDFDNDGDLDSFVPNPAFAYPADGAYSVKLKVTDGAGISDVELKIDYIVVCTAPDAHFGVSTTTPIMGQMVQFTDYSAGAIGSWLWEFGDGETSDVRNPSHSYAAEGRYTVSLTVSNAFVTDKLTIRDCIVVTNSDASSTPPGSEVTVNPGGAALIFDRVTTAGITTVTTSTQNPGGPVPSGYGIGDGVFMDVTTTAGFIGPINVSIRYDETAFVNENNLRLLHWNGSIWEDVTTILDTNANIIYGEIWSLSPFKVAELMEAPPTIASVSPNSGVKGQSLSVTITGAHFIGTTGVTFGSGITVNSFVVRSTTEITANITISGSAAIGARDVLVTTPYGLATNTGGFAVNQAPPTITSVSPSSGIQGESLSVTISGTDFTGVTAISFGVGIMVNGWSVDSATQITVSITISPTATSGARDVLVDTPGGTATKAGAFNVNLAPPAITSVTPTSGVQGQTLSVTIAGTYLTGATSVSFGSGITVNSFTVNSATQITANITISATTATGARDVLVTTPAGLATKTGGFTVNPAGPPATPSLVSPAKGTSVSGTSVTFEWGSVPGAVKYKLLVSTSTNILDTTKYKRNVDLVDLGSGLPTSYIDTGYPANGTKYYWWVWAYAADGSSSVWSQVSANGRDFTSMPSVGTPTLVSPTIGALVSGTSVTFQWGSVPGAVKYKLVVSTSTNILDTTKYKRNVDLVDLGSGLPTTYVDTGYPANGTKYYWWVWAYAADGTVSLWSQVSANGRWFTNTA
jgi:PKD repeat protein/sporulation protein YlmC with PRC-barrel domain